MEVLFNKQSNIAFKGITPALSRVPQKTLIRTGQDVVSLTHGAEITIRRILDQVAEQIPKKSVKTPVSETSYALVKRTNQALAAVAKKVKENKGLASWIKGVTDRKAIVAFLRNIKDAISEHAGYLRGEVTHGFNYSREPVPFVISRTAWFRSSLAKELSLKGFDVNGIKFASANHRVATFDVNLAKKAKEQYKLLLFRELLDEKETPKSLLKKWEIPGEVCLSDKENGFALLRVS